VSELEVTGGAVSLEDDESGDPALEEVVFVSLDAVEVEPVADAVDV
jgi:hypothetical protein